jgi:hypothetical protein
MRIDTIIGSLIGSFAIYGFVAACSSGPGGQLLAEAGLIDSPPDSPVPEAEAAPADCTQWEVNILHVPLLSPYNTGNWEPIYANVVNSGTGESDIVVRRCVP